LLRVLVVSHYAIEEVDIENLVGLVRSEYYHIITAIRTCRDLHHNLLQPLMKVPQHLLDLLNNFDIKIGLKLHYVLRDASLDLKLSGCLRLKGQFAFKVGVVSLLNVFQDFSVLFIFIRQLSAEKTLDHLVQLDIFDISHISESLHRLVLRLNPAVPIMHH